MLPLTIRSPKALGDIKMEDGVQCKSCHGPASTRTIDGKKHKSGNASADPKSNIHKAEEALCRTCYGEESPTWQRDRHTFDNRTTIGFDYKQA
jgi:hypothetical protein